jgi:hypothetical protein
LKNETRLMIHFAYSDKEKQLKILHDFCWHYSISSRHNVQIYKCTNVKQWPLAPNLRDSLNTRQIFSKRSLANVGKSGKSSQKRLANVGESGESLQNCLWMWASLASPRKSGWQMSASLASLTYFQKGHFSKCKYSPNLLKLPNSPNFEMTVISYLVP